MSPGPPTTPTLACPLPSHPDSKGSCWLLPGFLPVPSNHHLQEPLLGLSPMPVHSIAATGPSCTASLPDPSVDTFTSNQAHPSNLPVSPGISPHCKYHLVISYRISSIYAVTVHHTGTGPGSVGSNNDAHSIHGASGCWGAPGDASSQAPAWFIVSFLAPHLLEIS